ncbi:Glutaredoxin-1 [Phytophthora citrophthora]|uniref:Glutaredoxin-1 n=1 Tax=Phytophthora citrophthora TaxID=4793 RepID=A0AAD9LAY5_9STRA|nr:Glutaredoxin-1 [Phytophthora citrophthora]
MMFLLVRRFRAHWLLQRVRTNDKHVAIDFGLNFIVLVGRRTVPNVFIKKESIGGGTDVQALFQSGKLAEMLRTAGVM